MPRDATHDHGPVETRVDQRARDAERGVEPLTEVSACSRCADAERRASEAEAQFHSMFVEACEGLAISVDGKIVLANPALGALGHCDPAALVGKSVLDLTTPEEGARALARIRSGDTAPAELTAVRLDGSSFPCEVTGRTVTYGGRSARLTTFRDLTLRKGEEQARRRFDERLQSARKLETMGMIAGGVAHDFNNLLLVIMGHAELAMNQAPSGLTQHLSKIRAAAQAASRLTSQMLMFAGRGALDRELVALDRLVCETLESYQLPRSSAVLLNTDQVARAVSPIMGDSEQLRQVIWHLVINAEEAVSEHGSVITIRVDEVECSTADLHEMTVDASAGAGAFVRLEVVDDGCGMDDEILERIFDPFFSTKFQGRGLGLASVLGIIRSHAGAVQVESRPGGGSRFALLFPAEQD